MKEKLLSVAYEPEDIDLLFNLKGPFNTVTDIKDTGPQSLNVGRVGTITVGADTDGSYINIPATNSHYLSFGGNGLNGPNTIIEFEIKSMSSADSMALFDTRPNALNGNYSFVIYYLNRFLSRVTDTANNNFGTNSGYCSNTSNHFQVKTKIRMEYLQDKTYFYENNVFVGSISAIFSHLNQVYRIGYHNFNTNLGGALRLYSFRVFKRN